MINKSECSSSTGLNSMFYVWGEGYRSTYYGEVRHIRKRCDQHIGVILRTWQKWDKIVVDHE